MTDDVVIDLYCCQGGAAVGYDRAFRSVGRKVTIIGVDWKPQPRYPFDFIQGDVREVWDTLPHDRAILYHASPPCQAFSSVSKVAGVADKHPNLIPWTREAMQSTRKPYVIENVPGAPLENPITLCGSSFGLRVRKHRLFELSFLLCSLPCQHDWQDNDPIYTVRNHGKNQKTGVCYVFGTGGSKGGDWSKAMGIDWMTRKELSQAIPPAYTEWITGQMITMGAFA